MKKYLPLYIAIFICICETTFAQLKPDNAATKKVQLMLPVVHITPVSTLIKQVHVPKIDKPFVATVNNVQDWTEKVRAQCPLIKTPWATITLKAGRANNLIADLQWETKYAYKARGFNIERSLGDSLHFGAVRFALPSAGSGIKKNYKLPDHNDYSGISFYRIKQLNADSSYSYSNIVLVNGYDLQQFTIYPNPVSSGKVWIEATAKSNGNMLISLYDPSGKMAEQQSMNCMKNMVVRKGFDITNLASGVYQVRVLMPDQAFSIGRFIKE